MRSRFTVLLLVGMMAAIPAAGQQEGHPLATPTGDGDIGPAWTGSSTRVSTRGTPVIVFQDGADHILGQQCPDGGFGWPHADCSTTYNNITSPILMGVLTALGYTGDSAHLAGAVAGGDFDLGNQYGNGEPRLGAFTAFFMAELSTASGDPTYAAFAGDFFDQLQAGTYSDTDLDTEGWIALIETIRTGTWVNLRPWEFHLNVDTAAQLGNSGQSASFERGVLRGLDTLDNSDPGTVYSDIIGVAGAVRGLAFADRLSFPPINAPLHSGVDGLSTLAALGDLLVSYQNPNGSWYWHSNLAAPVTADEDAQSTAYAVLALVELENAIGAGNDAAIEAGQTWLESLQLPNGGFPSSPGGTENTEVEGEILWALGAEPDVSVLQVPTIGGLGAMVLALLLVGIGLVAIRRRMSATS